MSSLKRRIARRLFRRGFYFCQQGFCPCCQRQVEFLSLDPWLRDYFRCSDCGSVPRNRALMLVLEKHCPAWREKVIHESSPSAEAASARLKRECPKYVSSHYHPLRAAGELVDGHRNENLEAQTFADASFDLVITEDVLEHVYQPAEAFREIARTLKPGGAHVFSVPLVNKHRESQVWALPGADGKPQFLHEPEHHGPYPVTMHWGFDIVRHIRESCGLETKIEHLDDLHHGIRAEYIEILVTKKPAVGR